MKNKKAWIRIVEAFIAILIVLSAVLIVMSKQVDKTDISEGVYEKQKKILDVIGNNENYREEIIGIDISGDFVEVGMDNEIYSFDDFIKKTIPGTWDFTTCICKVDKFCNPESTPNDRDIFVSETVLSATLEQYPNKESRKLRFFVWREG